MSDLQTPVPVSIHVSDVHASLEVPAARGESPAEWLKIQRHYFRDIENFRIGLANDYRMAHERIAIVYAGDIFHKWNAQPELVNFLIDELPRGYSVAGNHDLPNHSLEEIGRSAYWTLCQAEVLADLDIEGPCSLGKSEGTRLYGFPCGTEVTPPIEDTKGALNVAVVHRYLWDSAATSTGYPGASEKDDFQATAKRFKGYDVVHVGDNHTPWGFDLPHAGGLTVFNPGAFVRRRSDERRHKPRVGVLYSDGSVKEHFLDTSKDRWADESAATGVDEAGIDSEAFLEELNKLTDAAVNFEEAVRRHLKKYPFAEEVVRLVMKHLESKK